MSVQGSHSRETAEDAIKSFRPTNERGGGGREPPRSRPLRFDGGGSFSDAWPPRSITTAHPQLHHPQPPVSEQGVSGNSAPGPPTREPPTSLASQCPGAHAAPAGFFQTPGTERNTPATSKTSGNKPMRTEESNKRGQFKGTLSGITSSARTFTL